MTTMGLQRDQADSWRPKRNFHYVVDTACAGHAITADRVFAKPWARG